MTDEQLFAWLYADLDDIIDMTERVDSNDRC